MTQPAPTAWPADGARLLEPSINYALGVVQAVTPELLSRPTPCREWDLRMLLRHASESLAAGFGRVPGVLYAIGSSVYNWRDEPLEIDMA